MKILFQDLCDFAQILLILPHSNADVERVFNQKNLVKSQLRNCMCLNTLNNIILIRLGHSCGCVKECGNYCINFEIGFYQNLPP
jgi:hypothetical protein